MIIKEERIHAEYLSEQDCTILIRETIGKDGMTTAIEIVGFHYGEPYEGSIYFIGRLKAEF